MKVGNKQIFNLMDTNGRRNDVVNAIQGYISILEEVTIKEKQVWNNMPESLAQFNFYKKAIELSPDVFKQHGPYDKLMEEIDKYPKVKEAIEKGDVNFFTQCPSEYLKIIKMFDKGIEDRARHYTSNLVKLGFTDGSRNISAIGELLLEPNKLKKDKIENTLPLDNINIIYLRQLMKLRVFDKDEVHFYSPFNMALYALIKRERMSENTFLELIQGSSPLTKFDSLDEFVCQYEDGDIVSDFIVEVPQELRVTALLDKDLFIKTFPNKKSQAQIEIYWKYYCLLYEFNLKRDQSSLNNLLDYFESERESLNKAFGCGKNIFVNRKGVRPVPNEFIKHNKKIFESNLNEYLYVIFSKSKKLDSIREYSDTTKRIFKATGIISFDNGYVELAYKELCKCIFSESYLKEKVFGIITNEVNSYYDCYEEYEEGIESYYCLVTSLCDILGYYNDEAEGVIASIRDEFDGADITDVPGIITDRRKQEFIMYIDNVYPIDKVKDILKMFSERKNDNIIKDIVSPDATVPTIYEYIVGIAWYYFSGKKIDLLESYNLTLSANFEPLIHAGGGQGDIVIYEENRVVMLEATLMNANSQKRGEWEPVLRHSVNLKIEEEAANTGREVTSFFIADSFDCNTINIWKAIASVPLQSSVNKEKFTDNVIIMPINNHELSTLIDKHEKYDEIIGRIRELFKVEKIDFDMDWRDKFIDQIEKNIR